MPDNPDLELGGISRGGATVDGDISHSPNDVPRASGRTSEPETAFSDGSGPMFNIYLKTAEEEDTKMTDGWKGDADGILVFTGLFSATVAGFLLVANQGLQPSSQDTAAFYLAHIYQVTAAGSSSAPVLPLPPNLSDPSTFTPSSSAIWVNVLWFMSLIISLTCALLATLLQQWSRRYLRLTGTRHSLHKRARIRAFFAEGLENRYFPWVVEALPTLLHASVFLFFAGLPISQFGTNRTVFAVILTCVGASGLAYLLITFMPLIFHDSLYHTPLSNLLWSFNAVTRSLLTKLLRLAIVFYGRLHIVVTILLGICLFWQGPSPNILNKLSVLMKAQNKRLKDGLIKEMEKSALESSWEIDARALSWALDSLDEDHELEAMLAAIPGFYNSILVKHSKEILSEVSSERISNAVLQLMDRSLSSDLVHEALRQQRSAMCLKVLEMRLDLRQTTFQQSLIFIGAGVFKWTDLACVAEQFFSFEAKCVTALVTAHTPGSNERLSPILIRELGVSEPVLQRYLTQGDSLLFLNFLDFVRWLVLPHSLVTRSMFNAVENVLNALRNFDATETSPELQHQFCTLWNAILDVQEHLARVTPHDLAEINSQAALEASVRAVRSLVPAFAAVTPPPRWELAASDFVAESFARQFIGNLERYRSLTRLILNRIAVVFVALHPSRRPGPGEATFPVPTDAWNEDNPREASYPRCDMPSHRHTGDPM